jgi:hypothetical protein
MMRLATAQCADRLVVAHVLKLSLYGAAVPLSVAMATMPATTHTRSTPTASREEI